MKLWRIILPVLAIGVIATFVGGILWRVYQPVGVSRMEKIKVSIHAADCEDSGPWYLHVGTQPGMSTHEVYSCLHTHPRRWECVAVIGGAITDVTDTLILSGTSQYAGVVAECIAYSPHW